MPVLSTLKSWLLGLLSLALAVMSALAFWRKSQLERTRADVQAAARKTERKATKAMVQGLAREQTEAAAALARRRQRLRDKPRQ